MDQLENCRNSEEESIKEGVRKEELVYLTFEVEKIVDRLTGKNRLVEKNGRAAFARVQKGETRWGFSGNAELDSWPKAANAMII